MQYELCRHIRTNGLRCKSPALNTANWCFYHDNLHRRHRSFRHTEATRGYLCPGQHIQLDTLEDRESVQVALSVVINALAVGHLDTKRATALLYGLQLASMNAATLHNAPPPSETVRTATETPEGLALAEPALAEPTLYTNKELADEYYDEDEDEEDDD